MSIVSDIDARNIKLSKIDTSGMSVFTEEEYKEYMSETLTEIHKPLIKEEPEKIIKAKIMKVLSHDGKTPKDYKRWMQNITYLKSMITEGNQAIWFEGFEIIRTSYVESIEEDDNNLVINTDNSIYFIKKLQD